ncbi:conjugal transfer protein MobC [Pedobacter nyackensis]|uniref:Type IV secretory pathway, VirD4 component, TraG/TraD family ATPase n=1 Tax=Pedobacter nyackensis TaxID=475255 RepID=A0A1W2DVT5_9SPHI|nr:conjugal transfer protein MobC [Pedobacter nyackensis]SMD01212.1 Type IV secretory pathway, VirD4 component, TraG/TraD family ATPase [Pedobacter nyackensis]
MNTGEDTKGLRKILDFTRLISLFILSIHFYIICYKAFKYWGWTADITDRIISNIAKTGLFNGILKPKLAGLLFLLISLLGAKGKKDEKIQKNSIIAYLLWGLLIYLLSPLMFYLSFSIPLIAGLYIMLSSIGYLLILTGGTWLSRLIKNNLTNDVFNSDNETFPQEERLLKNEYSFNLPTKYNLKGKIRDGWINCVNPFRSILVAGSGGAGKTYFVIRHILDQQLKKGFSLFLYDFKYDDLTKMAYNKLLKYQHNYKLKPKFYVINFEDLCRTHRCNPLDPSGMEDITDATEASRTIMMGLNRDWLKKQGDFFVESPINFLTAVIWYLRKYENGKYCTLPHVIELMQADYDPLFAVLQTQEEIKVLINPFISALRNNAQAQLEGQIASAKIGLARLASPALYYVLTGNDFTLDINNPAAPKIVCMGNNPQKIDTYGAVLSLYVNRMLKLINKKGKQKCSLIFDEYPTLVANLITTISTGRSNLISCTIGIQSIEQVKKEYGAEQAEIIAGICANIISGQVSGDSAKKLSETFGKIMQDRQSMSINSSDISISKSTQMDYAIPASKIATLSSGEFVGIVADSPDEKIPQKMFHGEIQNDHQTISDEEANYKSLPLIQVVTDEDVRENYLKVKKDVQHLMELELKKIKDSQLKKKKKEKNRKSVANASSNKVKTQQKGMSV